MSKSLRLPFGAHVSAWVLLCVWTVVALFPLAWLLVMSLRLPRDAFDPNIVVALLGPATQELVGGVSAVGIALFVLLTLLLAGLYGAREAVLTRLGSTEDAPKPLAVLGFYLGLLLVGALGFVLVLPPLTAGLERLVGNTPLRGLGEPLLGLTTQHYREVWLGNAFYENFLNTLLVTVGVVSVSLTIGTLAAYALARTPTAWAFWILIAALVFRSLPHSTLVAGYLPPFIEYGFYGQRLAVIVVLVAINQPFTVWMLRSFFASIPAALDEAALVDGCNRLQAFTKVIMPIMWPGVITTGLFSFMLAYNDFLVSALLLDGDTQTMVPAIMQYFNRETTLTDQLEAVAAAASITFPLFLLVLFFQRQIVSGLTQGAVKG